MSIGKNQKLDPLTREFTEKHPDTCAAVTTTAEQKLRYGVLGLFLLFLLMYRCDLFVLLVCGVMMLLYSGAVLIRLTAAIRSLSRRSMEHVSADEIANDDLPVYTILVPLYREPEVAEKIVKRIAALDYPPEKLDVKLLLESDDELTFRELKRTELPSGFTVLRIADAQPKTKPRACNFGLREAKGEFCVIYDAEDIPDPDQLRKAVAVFRRDSEKRLACVQAELNY